MTKPIPTPSRSYLLSIFRTLFYAPLLVIDALPETAEIEISIWGGSNRPFNSPDATGSVEFVIESCDIQILNAKVPCFGYVYAALLVHITPLSVLTSVYRLL